MKMEHNYNKNNKREFNPLDFKEKVMLFENNFKKNNKLNKVNNELNFIIINNENKVDNIKKNKPENVKVIYNNEKQIKKEEKENNIEKKIKKEEKTNNNIEKKIKKEENNFLDEFEISDMVNEDFGNLKIDPISKGDNTLNESEIDLWDIIPISTPSKKAKKEYMKSIMSTIVYNGVTFKDKLSESMNKSIIIFDSLIKNFSINQIKDYFVYMSYRNGLFNTKFFPGNKNDYSSDCGWGCMLRCCQMMLSRAFIKLKINELKEKKDINMKKIKQEILYLFYDKYINIENIHINKNLFEIYRTILKRKINAVEIIPPYSIYILTLLGNCPNVFTSDYNMIKTMIKINKILFNENIIMLHFNGTVDKKTVIQNFCEKIESSKDSDCLLFNSERFKYKKNGIIFILLRLGLQKIESCFMDMIPRLFSNLHNNIGFVSGKKKRAFYFIGLDGNKLIFADPHCNQNSETDEINFPTYSINELFLMNVKEMTSELTVGVVISSKDDLEQFFKDLSWFKEISPDFIGFQDK